MRGVMGWARATVPRAPSPRPPRRTEFYRPRAFPWRLAVSRRASVVHSKPDQLERKGHPQDDGSREADPRAPDSARPPPRAAPHGAQIQQHQDNPADERDNAQQLG